MELRVRDDEKIRGFVTEEVKNNKYKKNKTLRAFDYSLKFTGS